jgi:hypothetical protein
MQHKSIYAGSLCGEFALNQRQIAGVTAIQPENIERIVNGLALPFHELVKNGHAGSIQRNDFTVQY